jgi:hypothetical protein
MCCTMSHFYLDEVLEQRRHADEGEHRDGQELPHVEVEVRVDERLEKVIVIVPVPPKMSDSGVGRASNAMKPPRVKANGAAGAGTGASGCTHPNGCPNHSINVKKCVTFMAN